MTPAGKEAIDLAQPLRLKVQPAPQAFFRGKDKD
jgi:hypothetical protein